MSEAISAIQKLFFSIVSMTKTQNIASRFYGPKKFMPRVFVPRLAHGAGISMEEAQRLFEEVPSLDSKVWTNYWKKIGQGFEGRENFRAASMSYIMGCFPKEDFPWKDEINELKRASFKKWCKKEKVPFEERNIQTPFGKIRYYLCKPLGINGTVPMTIFLNGLEGSAEEFAFPLHSYINEGIGFASLSVPGSADYDAPMTTDSDKYLKYVIDDICNQPWVDASKVGMVGFSFGAYWTLICAKTDPRIKFSILNGIPFKHTFSVQQSYGINPVISHALLCMFRIFHPLQMLNKIRILSTRAEHLLPQEAGPVLVMNGDADTIVDPRDTELAAQGPGHKLLWIKNDDHCALFHYDRMVSVIVAWTKRCLRQISV